jgi:hypothetical protein
MLLTNLGVNLYNLSASRNRKSKLVTYTLQRWSSVGFGLLDTILVGLFVLVVVGMADGHD